MSFDLGKAIGSIAPTLATMLGGPLAGTAVSALASAFGLGTNATQSDITSVVQTGGMTPDIISAVRLADQKHAEVIAQQGLDLQKLNSDHQEAMAQTYTADTQDARKTFGQQKAVFNLGIIILITFAFVMTAVLWASYNLLTGGITIKDVAVVAAISGMVGSVVGYVAANAQQVVGYFFGSSSGSADKTDAMSKAVGNLVGQLGDKG